MPRYMGHSPIDLPGWVSAQPGLQIVRLRLTALVADLCTHLSQRSDDLNGIES